MAGYDYEAGRSNNMVTAESRGMVTIGRWAKQHKVSAAAAVAVMEPTEAHHTGTGRAGKSRLTPVIGGAAKPTTKQLEAMRDYDRRAKAALAAPPRVVEGCVVRYQTWPTTRYARRFPTEHICGPKAVAWYTATDGLEVCEWSKRSGVVVAKDGEVLFTNVNKNYDDPAEIAERICTPTPVTPTTTPAAAVPPPPPVTPSREARPLTADDLAALDAADLAVLTPMKRKARKNWLYAAQLPSRAEALDEIARRINV